MMTNDDDHQSHSQKSRTNPKEVGPVRSVVLLPSLAFVHVISSQVWRLAYCHWRLDHHHQDEDEDKDKDKDKGKDKDKDKDKYKDIFLIIFSRREARIESPRRSVRWASSKHPQMVIIVIRVFTEYMYNDENDNWSKCIFILSPPTSGKANPISNFDPGPFFPIWDCCQQVT